MDSPFPRAGYVKLGPQRFVALQKAQNGNFRRRAVTFFRPLTGKWSDKNTDDHDLFTPSDLPLHYCDFHGRLAGALGVCYQFTNIPILAPNDLDSINAALYSYYESISDLTVKTAPMPTLSLPFNLAKTDLTNDHTEALDIFLKQWHQGLAITIEGHACNTPVVTPESIKAYSDNKGFSEARAHAVRQFLAERGIPDQFIRSSIGYGDTRPKSANDKNLNRRVDITFVQASA